MASTLQNLLKSKAEKDKAQAAKPTPSTTNQSQVVPSSPNYPQVVPTPPKQAESTSAEEELNQSPTSPIKNFTKVPNSLTSEAIPQGLFKGLSKHTYDVLYKLTRGAINPIRKIQLTRFELMKMTGLSENTQRAHVKYLSVAGLLKITYQSGKHEGATYEVIVPEEVEIADTDPYQVLPSSTNQYQPPTSSTKHYQKLVLDTSQKLVGVGTTLMPVNIEVSDSPKTSFKDSKTNDDDAAFAGFIDKFQSTATEMTGRKIQKSDVENLEKIAELLILELKIAARRTKSISSVPGFLAEVLRQRFFLARQETVTRAGKTSKVKADIVGKSESDSYEIKPLDTKGRELALEQLQEFAADDFLSDFKKWYTPEDWIWLMEKLEKS